MSKVYWFKLPTQIKDKVEAIKATLVCLDDPTVDAALAEISWFRIPEKFAALVAATNALLTTDHVIGNNKWFKLEAEVEAYFTFLDGATCI